jgi:hypothetical protein
MTTYIQLRSLFAVPSAEAVVAVTMCSPAEQLMNCRLVQIHAFFKRTCKQCCCCRLENEQILMKAWLIQWRMNVDPGLELYNGSVSYVCQFSLQLSLWFTISISTSDKRQKADPAHDRIHPGLSSQPHPYWQLFAGMHGLQPHACAAMQTHCFGRLDLLAEMWECDCLKLLTGPIYTETAHTIKSAAMIKRRKKTWLTSVQQLLSSYTWIIIN